VWSFSLATDAPACPSQPSAPVFRIAWPIGQGAIAHSIQTHAGCFAQVNAHVELHWNPVEEYRRRNPASSDLGTRKWVTVLHIRLRADGSLADTQIVVPSGVAELDQIAISAVQEAQPFPPPSPDLVKQTGVVTVPMAFEILAAGTTAKP